MPHLNIPLSFNKTKSKIKDLGLDYKNIVACPNDCMLYQKEHKKDNSYYKCGASQWNKYLQEDYKLESSKKAHKMSTKT